ncbi:hypothetical protein GJ744_009947 [Endocarpon pusillum]|uniref:Uncharacterized protein n=1 Tax=Endocarpon pusillum TaxID=364733 RepID=A0A8H7E4J7_9EURO|nr:hypothetical protein GJ744_009947 [Endocarpon pusillum]
MDGRPGSRKSFPRTTKPEANPKHIEGSSERDKGLSKSTTQDHAQSARTSSIK